jgi:hypothetical protein
MEDSLAVTFSRATWRVLMLVWRVFFSKAPRRPRRTATWLIAESMMREALAGL